MRPLMSLRTATLLLLLAALSGACMPQPPVRIGFAGELTGHSADLGVEGRNGAQLAVDDINAAGGIEGRRLDLLVANDANQPVRAQQADQWLIDHGVSAIIGHMTSAQTLAGAAAAEGGQVLMLSPTGSTSQLSGQRDLFFRLAPATTLQAAALAEYVYNQRSLRAIIILADRSDAAYALDFGETFASRFSDLGGRTETFLTFNSRDERYLEAVARQVEAGQADGILLIASAQDTAALAQFLRLNGCALPLFASAWAVTGTLIRNGGRAVEGMDVLSLYDPNSDAPRYRAFHRAYEQRFGHTPSFAALYAYETTELLAQALRLSRARPDALPDAMRQIRQFSGLSDTVLLDDFGDAWRPVYILRIQGHAYHTLLAIAIEPPY